MNYEILKEIALRSPDTVCYLTMCYPHFLSGTKQFPPHVVGVRKITYDKARKFIFKYMDEKKNPGTPLNAYRGVSKTYILLLYISGRERKESVYTDAYDLDIEKGSVDIAVDIKKPGVETRHSHTAVDIDAKNTISLPKGEDIVRVAQKHSIDVFRLKYEWNIKLTTYESNPQYAPESYLPALERLAMKLRGTAVTKTKEKLFHQMKLEAWWDMVDVDEKTKKLHIGDDEVWFEDEQGNISVTNYKSLRSKHHGKLPHWI